jgi:hypothetical protein
MPACLGTAYSTGATCVLAITHLSRVQRIYRKARERDPHLLRVINAALQATSMMFRRVQLRKSSARLHDKSGTNRP